MLFPLLDEREEIEESQEPTEPPEVFLIDSCSVIRLDGKDRNPPVLSYNTVERELVWSGLEAMAEVGRIKVIKEVREELERYDPDGLERLKQYPACRLIIRRTQNVVQKYQAIASAYPDLLKGGSRFNPADPWLIVAADRLDCQIVTEELLKSQRTTQTRRLQKRERIPDVCVAEGLKSTISLRDLALKKGWIK
jgi:hypothetical protein